MRKELLENVAVDFKLISKIEIEFLALIQIKLLEVNEITLMQSLAADPQKHLDQKRNFDVQILTFDIRSILRILLKLCGVCSYFATSAYSCGFQNSLILLHTDILICLRTL